MCGDILEMDKSFRVREAEVSNYGLLCLKPVYGLNDAPVAWQFSLRSYAKGLGGVQSHLDENFWTWKNLNGCKVGIMTSHVDDLGGNQAWLDQMYGSFAKKFGKVSRQPLPFTHCGCEYERTNDGYVIKQQEFAKRMQEAPVPAEITDPRSIVGALLWITATRLDVIADVSALQARVTVAEVKDLKQANVTLQKVRDRAELGIQYRFLRSDRVRLVCVHDASSANKGRNYAQEGILIMLADGSWTGKEIDFEHVCETSEDDALHGGVMHVLHSHGAKAKRISYCTPMERPWL